MKSMKCWVAKEEADMRSEEDPDGPRQCRQRAMMTQDAGTCATYSGCHSSGKVLKFGTAHLQFKDLECSY